MLHDPDAADAAADTCLSPVARSVDEAMNRFAAGELAAFTEVYVATLPRVARMLGRMTRHRATAEDLAQDTMLRLYCARTAWRSGARVLPWANAIARRLFIDRYRRRRREQRAHDALTHRASPWAVDGRADAHLAVRRKTEALAAGVERLPARQREVMQLVYFDGKSLAEASAQLGETPIAVRVRVHRARRALEAALAAH
jgi:RNA polymerase sigma-70 factor, ECF subfamily